MRTGISKPWSPEGCWHIVSPWDWGTQPGVGGSGTGCVSVYCPLWSFLQEQHISPSKMVGS